MEDTNQMQVVSQGLGQPLTQQAPKECPPHIWQERGDYFVCANCGKNVIKHDKINPPKLYPQPYPLPYVPPQPWNPTPFPTPRIRPLWCEIPKHIRTQVNNYKIYQ